MCLLQIAQGGSDTCFILLLVHSQLVVLIHVATYWYGMAPPMSIFLDIARWVSDHSEHLNRFFCIAWGLWGRRNKMIYEKLHSNPTLAIEGALAIKENFQHLTSLPLSLNLLRSCWQPPPPDYDKFNVDGALFFKQKKVGVGFIPRD